MVMEDAALTIWARIRSSLAAIEGDGSAEDSDGDDDDDDDSVAAAAMRRLGVCVALRPSEEVVGAEKGAAGQGGNDCVERARPWADGQMDRQHTYARTRSTGWPGCVMVRRGVRQKMGLGGPCLVGCAGGRCG